MIGLAADRRGAPWDPSGTGDLLNIEVVTGRCDFIGLDLPLACLSRSGCVA
jgi:hypothetical protein